MVTGGDNFGENTDYLSVRLTYNDYAGQKVDSLANDGYDCNP